MAGSGHPRATAVLATEAIIDALRPHCIKHYFVGVLRDTPRSGLRVASNTD